MFLVFFFIALKVVLTVAFFMGGAWLMAEYFPIFAKQVLVMSDGTMVEFLGEWTAKVLRVIAKVSAKFLAVCFEWLEVLGFDFESVKESLKEMEDAADEAADAAS